MLTWARWELTLCWVAFFYPFIFRAPHWQKRPSIVAAGPSRIGILLEAAGIFLAYSLREPDPLPAWRIAAGMLLAPVGAAVAWSSVHHLGRQFRVQAGLWEDHELIRTGPYAVVRHPIYAALLAMLCSALLLYTVSPWWMLALAVYLAGTEIRVRTEDRLLASRFGAQAHQYQRDVRAYIPLLR